MTVFAYQLPQPSQVDALEDLQVLVQSSQWRAGSILRSRRPDAGVRPRRWRLTWVQVPGDVGAVLREHHRQHHFGDFDWTPPRAAAPVRVIYAEPLQLSWLHPASCYATATLEEVLAHD